MRLKTSSSFSLIEVLVTVAILSAAIIFILQALAASLSASRLSQNISRACYLTEEKIWNIKESFGEGPMREGDFRWDYIVRDTDNSKLGELEFSVFWPQKPGQEYSMKFKTYFINK